MYETDKKEFIYPDIWLIFIPYMALRGPQIAISRSKEVTFLQKKIRGRTQRRHK